MNLNVQVFTFKKQYGNIFWPQFGLLIAHIQPDAIQNVVTMSFNYQLVSFARNIANKLPSAAWALG